MEGVYAYFVSRFVVKDLIRNFFKYQSQALSKFSFRLHEISMILYKDIMPNFDKYIHVYIYGWNL